MTSQIKKEILDTKVITREKVDPEILKKLLPQTEEMGQVILHFIFTNTDYFPETYIRIWPTTYLYDLSSDHRSEMVHHENIVLYPNWQVCRVGSNYYFTLIFSGLPKSCDMFDFIEHCTNQSGAFMIRNIKRNRSDVYYLEI